LLSTLFLEVVLKKHATNASYFPAEAFVKEVELEIGGQKIDKLTSDWLRLYSEIYHSSDEKLAYKRLTDFENNSAAGDAGVEKRFFLPISFFFTRSPSLALPLVYVMHRLCDASTRRCRDHSSLSCNSTHKLVLSHAAVPSSTTRYVISPLEIRKLQLDHP